jgi:hypothetical protein
MARAATAGASASRPRRAAYATSSPTTSTTSQRRTPPRAALIDSVMARFLDEDIPVIHFLQIHRMANRFSLPMSPQTRPPVGTGRVFIQQRYNRGLAAAALATVLGSLILFIRSGRGRMALEGKQLKEHHLEPTL